MKQYLDLSTKYQKYINIFSRTVSFIGIRIFIFSFRYTTLHFVTSFRMLHTPFYDLIEFISYSRDDSFAQLIDIHFFNSLNACPLLSDRIVSKSRSRLMPTVIHLYCKLRVQNYQRTPYIQAGFLCLFKTDADMLHSKYNSDSVKVHCSVNF